MSDAARQPTVGGRRSKLGTLTPRELEILAHAAEGRRSREIAVALGIAEPTVKRHLTNVYRKLEAKNRVEAAAHYLRAQTRPRRRRS